MTFLYFRYFVCDLLEFYPKKRNNENIKINSNEFNRNCAKLFFFLNLKCMRIFFLSAIIKYKNRATDARKVVHKH